MCANYTPPTPLMLRESLLKDVPFEYPEEVYPGDDAPIVLLDEAGEWMPVRASFGLLPPWAKHPDFARYTYNARAETVAVKPSFRRAWARRQYCLIPVARFFEPCYEDGEAVRWAIERADQAAFFLAGLWERHVDALGRSLRSFTMLTMNAANDPLMRRFHAPDDEKRAVVVLDAQQGADWLVAGDDVAASELLRAWDSSLFHAQPAPRPRRVAKAPQRPAAPAGDAPRAPDADARQGRLFD